MKRFIVVCAAALMALTSFDSGAKGFLVKGGVAFQNVNAAVDAAKALAFVSPKGRIGWNAGVGFQTGTWGGFSLQPELLYRSKALQLPAEPSDPVTNATLSYLEVPVNVQWGIDLLFLRPFVFASPYVGFKLGEKVDVANLAEALKASTRSVSGGIGLGLGLEISKFQITAKYNWDFGGVANWTEYWEKAKKQAEKIDLKGTGGAFEIGLAILF